MRANYQEYLDRDDALGFMKITELSEGAMQLEPARWLLTKLAMHRDAFFEAVTTCLCKRWPQAEALRSVLAWSRDIFITIDYDHRVGKRFALDRDWPAWFVAARAAMTYRPLDGPALLPPASMAEVTDTGSKGGGSVVDLDWDRGNDQRRWERWVELMATGRTASSKNTFQDVKVPGRSVGGPPESLLTVSQQKRSEVSR